MQVIIRSGFSSAATARGAVVVIDVLRAFTTAAHAFGRGAARVVLVSTVEEAFAIRAARPEVILAGEVGGRPIEGFDLGNSPEAIEARDLTGRTVVLRSSSGTQGVVHARAADAILLGSLVVARATARHLAAQAPDVVTLLAMGSPHGPDGPEDEACADVLAAYLAGQDIDQAVIRQRVITSPGGQQALDPAADWITPGDLDRACAIDRFDFAMVVGREDETLVARAVPA